MRRRGSRRPCLPRGTERAPLIDAASSFSRLALRPWRGRGPALAGESHPIGIGLKFRARRLEVPCFTFREIARKGPRSDWNRAVSPRPRGPRSVTSLHFPCRSGNSAGDGFAFACPHRHLVCGCEASRPDLGTA